MVRILELQRFATLLGTVLFASVMLVGCVPETSSTQLDWFPPGGAPAPRVARNTPPPKPTHRPRPTVARNTLPPPRQVATLDCPVPTPKPDAATPGWYPTQTNYTPAPAAGGLAFAWPVSSGSIVSDFGATTTGGRNDGINIAAASGAPIKASAAGQISYAGNELRGYGNLVLIKHDGGYVTAYAHADRILVNRGDYVAKGQVIGYVGQTGDVTSPQLHFEIRKGVTPVNPRTQLGARTTASL